MSSSEWLQAPQKPELEHQQSIGAYDEIVTELTPESERLYHEWQTAMNLYKRAMASVVMEYDYESLSAAD